MNTLDSLLDQRKNEEFGRYLQASACKFVLHFDRDHERSLAKVPSTLVGYTEGDHYLSTKQVASATLLKGAGSFSLRDRVEMLISFGFQFEERQVETVGGLSDTAQTVQANTGPAAEYFYQAAETRSDLTESAYAGLDQAYPILTTPVKKQVKLAYEDPWLVIAGRIYSSMQPEGASRPNIKVWSGDGIRIQDPLPRRLLGPHWKGESTNQIRFADIGDVRCKLHLIYHHTHWGSFIQRVDRKLEPGFPTSTRWASSLKHRIRDFLSGKPDPLWGVELTKKIYSDPNTVRERRSRALRLIEVLKTVDGMFQQRYFAFPEEQWTWSKFDAYVALNLSHLLGDEFIDGALSEYGLSIQTRYSGLKRLRKTFKMHALRGTLSEWLGAAGDEIPNDVPRWLAHFVPCYRRIALVKERDLSRYTFLTGIMCQTRGCGTPPPLVVLQSKDKFLRTVVKRPEELSPTAKRLIQVAVAKVMQRVPDEAFTGLLTKARVQVSTSACWEKTRREGGTYGHIREIVEDGRNNVTVPIRDLDTGAILSHQRLDQLASPGEYIFWACLDRTVRTPLDDLRVAFLTVVKEPGKGRSVTKGRSYLKVVLDLVNKICSEPLRKIASSESGMGRSNHGWNFFQSQFDTPNDNPIFDVQSETRESYASYVEHDRVYHDMFVLSTDYQEATDAMHHDFARITCEAWMRKCGIPRFLRGIVHATCYQPRKIYFTGAGALAKHGDACPELGEDIRCITLEKGVLMGDPLTKVALHFTNIVTRETSTGLTNPEWLSLGFSNAFEIASKTRP